MGSIDVAQRLKEKQAELDITQAELAGMLDVSEAMISLVYSGRRNPGRAVIMGMLKVWPDVFSENGGGDGEAEGDGDSGDAGDDRAGDPVAVRVAGAPAAVGIVE